MSLFLLKLNGYAKFYVKNDLILKIIIREKHEYSYSNGHFLNVELFFDFKLMAVYYIE